MSDTRKLTVGVTINLGNSETLHVEVSDGVESEYDAAELRAFLVSVLDGYGTNDSAVRHTIDEYCQRVLADTAESADPVSFEEMGGEVQESLDNEMSMTAPSLIFSESENASVPEHEVTTPISLDDDDKRMVIDEDDYLRLPPAPLVEESDEEFVCSKCGASVSKLQRDVSMLFNHKILCKDCMR